MKTKNRNIKKQDDNKILDCDSGRIFISVCHDMGEVPSYTDEFYDVNRPIEQ